MNEAPSTPRTELVGASAEPADAAAACAAGSRRHAWLLALAIFTLGAALRLWQLGRWAPTHDELLTIALARLPRAERLALMGQGLQPSLFTVLEAGWFWAVRALAGHEVGLRVWRLLPVGLDLAALGLLLILGQAASARRRWAGALWAVSPVAVGAAQSQRPLALAAPLLLGLVLACRVMIRAGRWRWLGAAGMAACALALIYTHPLGVVPVAVLGLAALVGCWRRKGSWAAWAPGLCALGLIVLGSLPALILMARHADTILAAPPAGEPWAAVRDLLKAPLLNWPFGLTDAPLALRRGLCAAMAALFALLLGLAWLRWRNDNAPAPAASTSAGTAPLAWLLAWLLTASLGAAWLLGRARLWPALGPMRDLLAAPFLLLLGQLLDGATWPGAQGRRLAQAGGAALLLLMLGVSLHRPLTPAAGAFLWDRWAASLPGEFQPNNNDAVPAPRVVYPDAWCHVLPPQSPAFPLIPLAEWQQNPRAERQTVLLLEPLSGLAGYGDDESPRERFIIEAARADAGGAPTAVAGELRTSLLQPFNAPYLGWQFELGARRFPQAAQLEQTPTSVTALTLTHPAMHGFYPLEGPFAERLNGAPSGPRVEPFYRWTARERCTLEVNGPFDRGPYELLLCIDRPIPYPEPVIPLKWTLRTPVDEFLDEDTLRVPAGQPVLLRHVFYLEGKHRSLRLELRTPLWQPSRFIPGSGDRRPLGVRFFWAGLRPYAGQP